jgi:hypothetical protein
VTVATARRTPSSSRAMTPFSPSEDNCDFWVLLYD